LGTTIQWVFNKKRIRPGLVALTVSAALDEVQVHGAEFKVQCDAELRCLFPEVRNATLLHGTVIKEKQATPLISPDFENNRSSLAPCTLNLALCSDWTFATLPATIEAAARSGFRAVDALSGAAGSGQA
jgi:zeta-carotene desaturase